MRWLPLWTNSYATLMFGFTSEIGGNRVGATRLSSAHTSGSWFVERPVHHGHSELASRLFLSCSAERRVSPLTHLSVFSGIRCRAQMASCLAGLVSFG